MRRAVVAVVSVVALAGCERGCLARKLADRQSPAGESSPPIDLSGTDCPDGLARCVDGHVEVSRLAHLPHPCAPSGASPEARRRACECPWDLVAPCESGCAVEGVEVIATADVASVQLCRTRAPVSRPFLPGDPPVTGVCTTEEVRCADGVVLGCERPGFPVRPVAVCTDGCEPAVGWPEGVPGERATGDGPAMILCRRAHAERR